MLVWWKSVIYHEAQLCCFAQGYLKNYTRKWDIVRWTPEFVYSTAVFPDISISTWYCILSQIHAALNRVRFKQKSQNVIPHKVELKLKQGDAPQTGGAHISERIWYSWAAIPLFTLIQQNLTKHQAWEDRVVVCCRILMIFWTYTSFIRGNSECKLSSVE